MSKRQEATPSLRERLADQVRAFTLTRQEQAMVAGILLSIVVGAVVMHYRREYRLEHPVMVSPTPHRSG